MCNNLDYEEEQREELIGGEIVAMAPRPTTNHNRVAGNIYGIFWNHLRGKKCVPFGDGTDLYLTDQDRFVPDGMIVCNRDKIKSRGVYGAPDLVVEVLSPSTAKNDKGYKKDVYESCGVKEYWIADPAGKSIEVYRLTDGRYVLDNVYFYHSDSEIAEMNEEEKSLLVREFPCSLFAGLSIRLDDIFGDLL